MNSDPLDRIARKHACWLGLTREYSAHPIQATFITIALEKGCSSKDVQRAAGHADPPTTKL